MSDEYAVKKKPKRKINGTVVFSLYALVLAVGMILYSIFFTQFYIPSPSMENTLQINDRVLAQKVNEGDEIKRGDIVIFTDPDNWLQGQVIDNQEANYLVKRVIAVGGDHIMCCDVNGHNILNGEPLIEDYIANKNLLSFDVTVPEGYVWVEGDNRQNSADSRLHQMDKNNGMVPVENITHKANMIVWPLNRLTVF